MTMDCQTVRRYPIPSCAQTPVWQCVNDQMVSVWLGHALEVRWSGYGEWQCVALAWRKRHGLVTAANLANTVSYSVVLFNREKDGLEDTTWEMVPLVCSSVVMSTNLPCFMLTRSWCSCRKSAPMIGVKILAMTKIQWNTHLSPKSSVRDRVPKVAMGEPLTAQRTELSCLFFGP